jgi:hypothetical protein
MLMRTCQRCIHGEVSWTADTTLLVGEVSASLCNACLTEFAAAVRTFAAWRRRLDLDARRNYYVSLAKAGTPVSETQWTALHMDLDTNEMELHAIAVEFVRPIPSPVPAAEEA